MKKIASHMIFGNRFFGIEQVQKNDKTSYQIIELKKVKDQIEIQNTSEVDTIKDISKSVPKEKPAFLVINDQSVVTKKVSVNETDPLKLLNHAFPNLKIDDFYYEILSLDQIHFVSICRKAHVNKSLETYLSHHISVINFSLGNLMISSISNFISEDKIQTNNATILKLNGLIKDIQLCSDTIYSNYSCNGIDDLSNKDLLAFSSGLSLITRSKPTISSFRNRQQELLINFKEKRFFKQFMVVGFSILFTFLLINSMMFTDYYDRVNELKETAHVLNVSKNKVIQLNDKVQTTKKMVDDVLKGNASQSSFYTDAIIQSLPKEIILSELNYQPLLKRIKENKPIINEMNTIIISGDIPKNIRLSQWITHAEDMPWVNVIEIITFEDTSNRSSHFSLKIRIKDETKT